MEPKNAQAYLCMLMASQEVKHLHELETHHKIYTYRRWNSDICGYSEIYECTSIINNSNTFQKALRFADPNLKKELEEINIKNIEFHYNYYLDKLRNTQDRNELVECEKVFYAIASHKDSRELSNQCIAKIEELEKQAEEQRRLDAEHREKNEKKIQDINKKIADANQKLRKCKLATDVIKKPKLAKFLAILVILTLLIGASWLIYFGIYDDDNMFWGLIILVLHFIFSNCLTNLAEDYDWLSKFNQVGCLLLPLYPFFFAIAVLIKLRRSRKLKSNIECIEREITILEEEKAKIK